MRSERRTGSLGRALPVDVVEPDGLIVTSTGRYVRLVECERLPNAITADPVGILRIELAFADDEQLLSWCAGIVALARKNGYLSTTADTIAVYHTSVMLAQLRKEGLDRAVGDFLCGMTDRYAMRLYQELRLPRPWTVY